MDWFSPVTRSNPASVRARAETLRQKQAKRSTETPWKFEVGQQVKKLCRTSHSNTEKEWCNAVVISLKNTESAPVYTLLFQYDAHQERLTHTQLDTLLHEQPPVPYQHPRLRRKRSKTSSLTPSFPKRTETAPPRSSRQGLTLVPFSAQRERFV
jgi:heat shock protein HspQ